MPLEGMLDRATAFDLDGGMALADEALAQARSTQADRDQITALAGQLAKDFRPLLEWLCDITLRRPVFLPTLGPDALAFVAHREGQNLIVWELLRAVAEGQAEPLQPRPGFPT